MRLSHTRQNKLFLWYFLYRQSWLYMHSLYVFNQIQEPNELM
jgi:hypothetical protein